MLKHQKHFFENQKVLQGEAILSEGPLFTLAQVIFKIRK